MRKLLIGLVVLGFAAAAGGQSLAEIAKKEKERRKKNKEKGSQVHVITADELAKAKAPAFSSTAIASSSSESQEQKRGEGGSSGAAAGGTTTPPSSGEGGSQGGEDEEGASEEEVPTDIPANASMAEKISAFQAMLRSYKAEVQKIDQQMAKNRARLAEIEQQLISINATGVPTAPQVDRQQRNPADYVALQQEQQQLREQNLELERKKKALADELREKGRRAGIPAGYLRF